MRELIEYHRWSTLRMLESCATLTPADLERELGGSFPNLRHTLAHMLMAETAWSKRVRGEAYARPSPGELPDDLQSAWLEVLSAWEDIARTRDPREVIEYRTFDGTPNRNTIQEIAQHVVNHGSYHRGQVTMMLRLLGQTPQGTDWIVFTRVATD
jgi:uncharacterized damage-inducible protein DinB